MEPFAFSPELTARAARYFEYECGAALSRREVSSALAAMADFFTAFQQPQSPIHSREVLGSDAAAAVAAAASVRGS